MGMFDFFKARSKPGQSRTGMTRIFQDHAWPERSPERFARDGFKANATAYALIMLAARAAAGVPWVLYQRGAAGKGRPKKFMTVRTAEKAWMSGLPFARKSAQLSEVEDHPALKLWERPNPLTSGSDFVEAWEAFMLITGMSFTEKVLIDNKQRIGALWMVQPQRMMVVPDPIERIAGYAFVRADGSFVPFGPNEIMYTKFFNPTDDILGLSPLQASANAIDTDNEAAKWNYNLLKNAAMPPGGLVTEQVLDDRVYDRLKKEIKTVLSGAKNARRPVLLDGGVDWRNFSYSPADLDWLSGRKMSKREMYGSLSIGGELVGDPDSKTYASAKEARKGLYTERVLPDLDKLKAALNKDVAPAFGDGLFFDYDRDQIEALQEEQGLLMDRMERCTFLEIDEKRVACGFDEIGGSTGKLILVNSGMTPLDLIAEGGAEPTPEPTPEPEQQPDDPIEKARRVLERMRSLPS